MTRSCLLFAVCRKRTSCLTSLMSHALCHKRTSPITPVYRLLTGWLDSTEARYLGVQVIFNANFVVSRNNRSDKALGFQRPDTTIHWINHYPVDGWEGFGGTFPLGSTIQLLNNWGQGPVSQKSRNFSGVFRVTWKKSLQGSFFMINEKVKNRKQINYKKTA